MISPPKPSPPSQNRAANGLSHAGSGEDPPVSSRLEQTPASRPVASPHRPSNRAATGHVEHVEQVSSHAGMRQVGHLSPLELLTPANLEDRSLWLKGQHVWPAPAAAPGQRTGDLNLGLRQRMVGRQLGHDTDVQHPSAKSRPRPLKKCSSNFGAIREVPQAVLPRHRDRTDARRRRESPGPRTGGSLCVRGGAPVARLSQHCQE